MKKKTLFLTALASIATILFLYFPTNGVEKQNYPPMEPWFLENEKNSINVFEKRANLVVFVHNLANYRDFFSFRTTQVQQGTGSGFIWNKKGHIVTNYHVVRNASEVAVTLKSGQVLDVEIIGAEPRKDLAVLKVNPKKIKGIEGFSDKVASSDTIRVGQKALAIGNPFGLDHTLTVGTVSALNRSLETFDNVTIRDMIQTDAAINPGNSGGPLLDSRGFLIGMNTGIYSNSGSSAGVGFAVPSNTIQLFVEQIIKYGKVIQPGLGFIPMDPRRAAYLDVHSGVLIEAIAEDSSAAKAGLRGTYVEGNRRRRRIVIGDIIIGIDSEKIENYDDLYNVLIKKKIGQTVNVKYVREGKEKSVKLKLQKIEN